MAINKVILVGNLGKDPELRHTPSGVAVATFSLATSESYKDQGGNKQEKTEWHNIVAWRQLAEICANYLHKGKQVYIEGKIQTRKYQDRDGNDRYITEIVADQMQMLGGAPQQQGNTQQGGYQQRPQQGNNGNRQQAPQQGNGGRQQAPQGNGNRQQAPQQGNGGRQQAPQQGGYPQASPSGGGGGDWDAPFNPDDEIPFAVLPPWREFVK